MARRAGASVRSRQLVRTLRNMRITAELSCAELGAAVDMSPSKISRFENSDTGIYRDDLEKLLDFYKVRGKRRTGLLDLASHAEQRDLLRIHGPNLPQDWQAQADFEAEASALFTYEPLMLPGLLQTAEYASAVIAATGDDLSEDRVHQLVASRMARQSQLTRSRPLTLLAVIEESVLTRPIGNAPALERQLNQLADSATRPNVTVRVLPTNAGPHSGLNGPFAILDYDAEPSMVLLENKTASAFLDGQEHIATYSRSRDQLLRLAHDEDTSVDLIRVAAARSHN